MVMGLRQTFGFDPTKSTFLLFAIYISIVTPFLSLTDRHTCYHSHRFTNMTWKRLYRLLLATMIVRCVRKNYFRMEPARGLVSECQTFLYGRFNVIQCGMYRGLSIIKIRPRGGCNYASVVASNPRAEQPRSRVIFQTGKIERERGQENATKHRMTRSIFGTAAGVSFVPSFLLACWGKTNKICCLLTWRATSFNPN
jgi:hypothetical protein